MAEAEEAAPSGEPAVDLVLTGLDGLVAGIEQGLWLTLVPGAGVLADLERVLSPAAWPMQKLAQGRGVVTAFSPIGPLLNYVPARVGAVPQSAGELLDWARAHPRRFAYADPQLAEGSRALLMSLPYMLGDADPKDPERGWARTWSYLDELGKTIASYPVTAGASFEEMKKDRLDICVSSLPDDLGSRMGSSAVSTELLVLRDFRWVGGAYYAAIPASVAPATAATLLALIGSLLSPAGQALAYGRGSFYPGPAIEGVGLEQAPAASRALIGPAERAIYPRLIAEHPIETPLAPAALRYAIRRWARQIGGGP